MNRLKYSSIALLSLLLIGGLAFIPAYARGGTDSETPSANSDSTTVTATELHTRQEDKSASTAASRAADKEIENHDAALITASRQDKMHLRAKELEAEARKKGKVHSEEDRRANCDARKDAIVAKLSKMVSGANAHKSKFDSILAKAVAYHDTNSISSAAYDSALTAANAAQTQAAASIGTLSSTTPVIDCSNKEVASNIAAFKAAAEQARADLKIYRSSVKAVLETLKKHES